MNKFYEKYKLIVPLIVYMAIYLLWFMFIEKNTPGNYRVIHVNLDDYIPFCELFVIPYFLWFFYVSLTVIYFFIVSKEDYVKTCLFLFTGMTVFLIVSTLLPNGHHLRPGIMPRDNIFTQMISGLYKADTATNIWPSIHVFNSLGAHFAIVKSNKTNGNQWVRRSSLLLCISIILSTVFIKQHSLFDVVTAFIMAAVLYGIVYKYDIVSAYKAHQLTKKKPTPQVD